MNVNSVSWFSSYGSLIRNVEYHKLRTAIRVKGPWLTSIIRTGRGATSTGLINYLPIQVLPFSLLLVSIDVYLRIATS